MHAACNSIPRMRVVADVMSALHRNCSRGAALSSPLQCSNCAADELVPAVELANPVSVKYPATSSIVLEQALRTVGQSYLSGLWSKKTRNQSLRNAGSRTFNPLVGSSSLPRPTISATFHDSTHSLAGKTGNAQATGNTPLLYQDPRICSVLKSRGVEICGISLGSIRCYFDLPLRCLRQGIPIRSPH